MRTRMSINSREYSSAGVVPEEANSAPRQKPQGGEPEQQTPSTCRADILRVCGSVDTTRCSELPRVVALPELGGGDMYESTFPAKPGFNSPASGRRLPSVFLEAGRQRPLFIAGRWTCSAVGSRWTGTSLGRAISFDLAIRQGLLQGGDIGRRDFRATARNQFQALAAFQRRQVGYPRVFEMQPR